MPLQPRITGDDVVDQWSEEVTYELNNVIAQSALTAASMVSLSDDQEIVPVYASSENGADQSLALGDRDFVYFYTNTVGNDVPLPLTGVVFTRFRGADTRTVEITVRTIPTAHENSLGVERNYTDFNLLVLDWSIGAVTLEDFPEDPDGIDFSYRTTNKMLVARVRKASDSADPDSAYEDPTLSRSFDYLWNRNGKVFTPALTGVLTDYPFLYISPSDVTDADPDEPGVSSQFFCNIVQL